LDTNTKRSVQYGRLDARVKVSSTKGSWPGWWGLGTLGTFPGNGEIDIFEYRPGVAPLEAHHAAHGATTTGAHWQRAFNTNVGTPWAGSYHVFAIEWKPDQIEFLIDGVSRFTVSPASMPLGGVWPFNAGPFYLLLNQAVGNWGCAGASSPCPDPAQFPSTMLVDYVRVYQ